MHKIAVIGVPSSAGARQPGQERAPAAFRQAGLIARLTSPDLDVLDFGDLPLVSFRPDLENPRGQNLALVVEVDRQVADEVARAVQTGAKPIVLGGDCTITLGVLSGLVRGFPDLGMVYFDGDVDLNTPAETSSGIFDGMGMAHIIGEGVDELTHLGPRFPLMPQSNIVLFGYNPQSGWIDEAEVGRLERCSMARYSTQQIRGKAKQAALEALESLGEKAKPILVHFDVDVIDSTEFPAADVLHEHGLAYSDALEALSVFVSTPRIAGLVVTEFNLNRDPDGALARRLVDSVAKAIQLGSRHWEEHDPA